MPVNINGFVREITQEERERRGSIWRKIDTSKPVEIKERHDENGVLLGVDVMQNIWSLRYVPTREDAENFCLINSLKLTEEPQQ